MTTATTELLTRHEVQALLKCSRSSLYAWMESAAFPKPIKLGSTNRWVPGEIEAWIQMQPRAVIQDKTGEGEFDTTVEAPADHR